MTSPSPTPPYLRTVQRWRTEEPAKFEDWEERAAIMTFCGGMTVETAERQAYEDIQRRYGK